MGPLPRKPYTCQEAMHRTDPASPRSPVARLGARVRTTRMTGRELLAEYDRGERDFRSIVVRDDGSLVGCRLDSIDLEGAILRGADLTRASLAGARLARADLTSAVLVDADLTDADLREAIGMTTTRIAGANLGGASVADFDFVTKILTTATATADTCQRIFLSILAVCAYCWVVLATTQDGVLLTNSAFEAFPLVNVKLPIVAFYWLTPLALLALHAYFHLHLIQLWEQVALLPAVLPDGRSWDQSMPAWMFHGIARTSFPRFMPRRELAALQAWLAATVAWGLVPATVAGFWARYLPRHHDCSGIGYQAALTAVAMGSSALFLRASWNILSGRRDGRTGDTDGGRRPRLRPLYGAAVVGVATAMLLALASGWPYSSSYSLAYLRWRTGRGVDPGSPICGHLVPADLRNQRIATALDDHAGDGSPDAKPVRMRGALLADADLDHALADGATFENADLRDSTLVAARLRAAHLQNANLEGAQLMNADLGGADLREAVLHAADLRGANLMFANLAKADLDGAKLRGADFFGACLVGVRGINPDDPQFADAYIDPANEADRARNSQLRLQIEELSHDEERALRRITGRTAEDASASRCDAFEVVRPHDITEPRPSGTGATDAGRATNDTSPQP
jgi:uncharacterized protein YjbI with pentapeptide repeats